MDRWVYWVVVFETVLRRRGSPICGVNISSNCLNEVWRCPKTNLQVSGVLETSKIIRQDLVRPF